MLKQHFPKSQPSPLRITTHTIKAMFGCNETPETLVVKPDFKLDLLRLSANLELNDKIKYIEYVTKSDNYVIEFTEEGITDEINISRINIDSSVKKKIKVGDKVNKGDLILSMSTEVATGQKKGSVSWQKKLKRQK